jgi:carbon storage regulator
LLILNRREDESIIISDNIEIKILSIDENKVKIGIEAPREITILRREIYDEVIEENKKSIEVDVDILDILKDMD